MNRKYFFFKNKRDRFYTFHNVLGSCLGTGIVEQFSKKDLKKALAKSDLPRHVSVESEEMPNGVGEINASNNNNMNTITSSAINTNDVTLETNLEVDQSQISTTL